MLGLPTKLKVRVTAAIFPGAKDRVIHSTTKRVSELYTEEPCHVICQNW